MLFLLPFDIGKRFRNICPSIEQSWSTWEISIKLTKFRRVRVSFPAKNPRSPVVILFYIHSFRVSSCSISKAISLLRLNLSLSVPFLNFTRTNHNDPFVSLKKNKILPLVLTLTCLKSSPDLPWRFSPNYRC